MLEWTEWRTYKLRLLVLMLTEFHCCCRRRERVWKIVILCFQIFVRLSSWNSLAPANAAEEISKMMNTKFNYQQSETEKVSLISCLHIFCNLNSVLVFNLIFFFLKKVFKIVTFDGLTYFCLQTNQFSKYEILSKDTKTHIHSFKIWIWKFAICKRTQLSQGELTICFTHAVYSIDVFS